MPSRIVTVGSRVGLHARPASVLVKTAAAAGVSVTIGRVGDNAVNATSVLSVLALGVKHGEEIEIVVAAANHAEAVLDALAAVITTDYDQAISAPSTLGG